MKKYLKYFSYIFLLLSNILFLVFLFKYKKMVSLSYINIIIFYIFNALLVYITGLLTNEEKVYKFNIKLYIILYLICLLSVTIFDRAFINSTSPINQLLSGNFIPFHSINRYFKTMYLPLFLRNIVDNMLCLLPLSFLLIILNDKYKSILKQLPILLIIDVCIEILQGLTGCGICDVDDVLLNVGFAIIFTLIFKNFIIKIKPIFYKEIFKNRIIKYILWGISLILVLIFDISLISNTIYYLNKKEDISFSYSGNDTVVTTKTVIYNLYELNIEVYYNIDGNSYSLDEALSKYGTTIFDSFVIIDNDNKILRLQNDSLEVYEINDGKDIYIGTIGTDFNKYLNAEEDLGYFKNDDIIQ